MGVKKNVVDSICLGRGSGGTAQVVDGFSEGFLVAFAAAVDIPDPD